jgi:hypothetical protein
MSTVKSRLERLEEVFQGPADKCRCGEPRWLICECSGLDQQEPPTQCWQCCGRDPQGVHVIVETEDEHGEPVAAVEDQP